MQRKVIAEWVLILGAGLVLGQMISCLPPAQELDPFPARVITEFSLQNEELPLIYGVITNSMLLKQAGLTHNPDYLTKRDDLNDMIQMDGIAAFLALYGHETSVRLMVKGVFFRDLQCALKYADVQKTRQRLVTAYRRDTPKGIWLLFIACDHGLAYDDSEMALINQGLAQYQQRLKLIPLFDQMNNSSSK